MLGRKILLDEPSQEDLFHGKGHDRTAAALASAIRNFSNADRAIGLDGPWGSGKSSVVGIAERKLQVSMGDDIRFHFFTFDIWKSQGSAFRRSFLGHLVSWSITQFPKKSKKLAGIDNKIKGKVREVDTDNHLILDWYGIIILLAVPFLPIYVLWSKSTFDKLATAGSESEFLFSLPMWLVYCFLIGTFAVALWKYSTGDAISKSSAGVGRWRHFQFALSRTLLIGAKQYEHQKVTQYIRETDPNDFEFQSVLREILATIQDKHNKVVIVLDNIDRLPADEISGYWALVRSIFSRTHSDNIATDNNHITAVVPYDRRLIETKTLEPSEVSGKSTLRARGLFAKTFDEVLTVAPPVMSNTRDFFHEKIKEALPVFEDGDALFRVYLVFNWITDSDGGRATPRQVISYVNELTGLYVLHDGRIGLPTVAVYLAVKDRLESRPAALAKEKIVDDHLKSLANDRNLEKNLAAILFNVEPELAFQILLDNEIKSAINAENSNRLTELSAAPGFDVRVNEVFSVNVGEWTSGGRFALAVQNVCDLLETYSGEAAAQLKTSVVEGFCEVPAFTLGQEAERYERLIHICHTSDRQRVFDHMVLTASASLKKSDGLNQSKGREFVRFLSEFTKTSLEIDDGLSTGLALKKVILPQDPDFLFGFAVEAHVAAAIKMTDVTKPTIDLSSDVTFLETVALSQTADCLAAFASFRSVRLVSDPAWIAISNHLVRSLVDGSSENHQGYAERLTLLGTVRSFLSYKKLEEIDLSQLLGSSAFYESLSKAFSNNLEDIGLAHAVSLASIPYLEGNLSSPTRVVANNIRQPAAQEEFAWFGQILEGSAPLSLHQYHLIADEAVAHLNVPDWVVFGKANPDNKLAVSVIRAAFAREQVPWMSDRSLFQNYSYLKAVLADDFAGVLPKLGAEIEADTLAEFDAASYPVGILMDTREFSESEWKAVHDRAREILDNVSEDDWLIHLSMGDDYLRLLCEMIKSSSYSPESTALKSAFLRFVLGVLDGSITPTLESTDYDIVMDAIDKGYRLEFFKQIREEINGVTAGTIALAARLFPVVILNCVKTGDKSRQEKDKLVRFILRPSLEGGVASVVDHFLALGRKTVADFIRSADQSTKDTLDPALRLLSKTCDYEYVRKVTELLQGKKAKTWLDILFPTKDDGEEAG
ncbi:P-loop NTPase fold protein [Phyllobacterium sp. CCNWLW109]|uniref:P-loop NTPase fold protein n=1 Tax=Phyllobacterium sp. CCNWLW109 TaxID=3127479 RepID=UPI00307717AD